MAKTVQSPVQSLLKKLGRLPFTLAMLAGISIAGLWTGTPTSTIDPIQLKRWGFALHDLWQGTWYSLVTEVFFTSHPSMFWGIGYTSYRKSGAAGSLSACSFI